MKPEEPHVRRVVQGVLRTAHALEVFVIEPIHIRMRVPRIASSSVDVPSVHRPKVGDDVNVRFRDVWGNVAVDESRNELRLHCLC